MSLALFAQHLFMHNFMVSDWSEVMLGHLSMMDGVRLPPFPNDLYVGWGAHSKFRQVSTLPCLLVSSMSSVHVSSSTISPGLEDSMVFLRHVGGGSQGCLQSSSPSVVSHFQDLPITFMVLLSGGCLSQLGWLPQTCSWDCYICWRCCWTAYFHLWLQINWASLALKLP